MLWAVLLEAVVSSAALVMYARCTTVFGLGRVGEGMERWTPCSTIWRFAGGA